MASKALTQTEAAERLRISTSWLRVLSDRGVVRRNSDGSYPWPEVAEDYKSYREEDDDAPRGNGSCSGANEEWQIARSRKELAVAQLREQELAARARELIPAEEVFDRVRRPLEEVDAKLRAAPRTLAREWSKRLGLTQAETIALVGDLVEDVRSSIREAFEEMAAG